MTSAANAAATGSIALGGTRQPMVGRSTRQRHQALHDVSG